MYRNILVPIDPDSAEDSEKVLSTLSSLAEEFNAKITLCSVVSDAQAIEAGEWLPISVEQKLFDTRARLEGIAAGVSGERVWGVEVTAGSVAGGILEIAERMNADLIVLFSHQPKALDFLRAANAIRVASKATCSVLIARQGRG